MRLGTMRRVVAAMVCAGGAGFAVPSVAEVAPGSMAGAGAAEGVAMAETGEVGFGDWLDGFRTRALAGGIPEGVLDAALPGLRYLPDVVERDRNQAEFTRTIWDYLEIAVSEERVANGLRAVATHAAVLDEIERRHGVDKEIVAAIWGLESAYGAFRGSTSTLSALATLAHDGRRAAFFEGELMAALKILAAGDVRPERMEGSWAGAMGHTQFMPTSYLALAVDHDGDGRRDVWGDDPADALASAAAYLKHWGWTAGRPWGVEVTVPGGFDYGLTGERVKKSAADWAALGVRAVDGSAVPDHGPASVLMPAGHEGAAFMIFGNFAVIERYNPADAYVIAVGHLADRLKGGPPIAGGWPRQDRALTGDERRELQERLTAAGYDTQGVDGRIGPKTIAAIRAYQRSRGAVPDGYASPRLLEQLR